MVYFQCLSVYVGGVLNTPVGVKNKVLGRLFAANSYLQGLCCQPGVNAVGEGITNHLPEHKSFTMAGYSRSWSVGR